MMADTTTTDQVQVALQTAVQTLQAAVPVVAASVAPINPNVALAVQLILTAIQSAQRAQQIAAAGTLTPDQATALAQTISQGIQQESQTWAAMGSTPTIPVAGAAT